MTERKYEFEDIVVMYEFLTNRWGFIHSYSYEGFYRCFDKNHNGVKGNNLKILKEFEELTMREVFKEESINGISYGDKFLDAKLVKDEEKKVCIHPEMGFIFLEIIVQRLKNTMNIFLERLEILNKNYTDLVKKSEDGYFIRMSGNTYDQFQPQFEKIENYDFLFRFIALTHSQIMYRNMDNVLEINVSKMNDMIKNLSKIDFKKIRI